MRKFVLSMLALFVCVGLTIAAQVTFVKYDEDKKALTVKEGDKEKTYTITDKTTFKRNDKDVASDKALPALKKMKADAKLEITVDGDKLTEVKLPGKKN